MAMVICTNEQYVALTKLAKLSLKRLTILLKISDTADNMDGVGATLQDHANWAAITAIQHDMDYAAAHAIRYMENQSIVE